MSQSDPRGVSVHVGRDLSGQVVIGDGNVTESVSVAAPVTAEERVELAALLDGLRVLVAAQAGAETAAALGKLDELGEAIDAETPDLATMEHVHGWFVRKLSTVAGAVRDLVVHPTVVRLVAAAGDTLAAEFRRRFGGN